MRQQKGRVGVTGSKRLDLRGAEMRLKSGYKKYLTGLKRPLWVFMLVAFIFAGALMAFAQPGANITGNGGGVTFSVQAQATGFAITTTELAHAASGSAYSFFLQAANGVAPYTWNITSALPSWLSYDAATGEIRGAPSAAGTLDLHIIATDSSLPAQSAETTLTLTVNPPLTISTAAIPVGAVGVPYSAEVTATGGLPPYQWSGSFMPEGLSIDPLTGVISGTPKAYFKSLINVSVKSLDDHTGFPPVWVSKWLNLDIKDDSIIATPVNGVLSSGSLDGSMVNLKLISSSFKSNSLTPDDFTLINPPAGLSIAEATYLDSSQANIKLAYSGGMLPANITDFRFGVKASAVNVGLDLVSNISVITAPMAATVQSVTAGNTPTRVAVNASTGKAYVTNQMSRTVTIVDTATPNPTVTQLSTNQRRPLGVAANPVTNRIYVANKVENTVSVIDGSTNTLITNIVLGVGDPANDIREVAVNSITNKIYVTHYTAKKLVVINGSDNTFKTISLNGAPSDIAINTNTNRLYVAVPDVNDRGLIAVDGSSDSVIGKIDVGYYPESVAVNQLTDRIYVASSTENKVRVISGTTNTVINEIPVGYFPVDLVVNEATNRIYTANSQSNTVSVINGTDNTVAVIPVPGKPMKLVVNTVANRIYVTGSDTGLVTMINGSDNSSTSIKVGSSPVSMDVNPVNGKVYVPDGSGCSIITPNAILVSSISINEDPVAMTVGDSKQLTVTVLPDDAADKSIVWSVSTETPEGIISLSDGLVSAKKSGTAVVRATNPASGAFDECTISVSLLKPVIAPNGGSFAGSISVSVSGSGGDIYYTTDGSDPTTSNTKTKYTTPFNLTQSATVRAAVNGGTAWSEIASAEFTKEVISVIKTVTVNPISHTEGTTQAVQVNTALYENEIFNNMMQRIVISFKDDSGNTLSKLTVNSGFNPSIEQTLTVSDTATAGNYTVQVEALLYDGPGDGFTDSRSIQYLINKKTQSTDDNNGSGSHAGGSSSTKTTTPTVEVKSEVITPPVTDINNHWAHDCIAALLQHGEISGYPDHTIRPDKEITRAEVANLLVSSLGLQSYQLKNKTNPYKDELSWSEKSILIATENGLMKGYPDGMFKPDQKITRAEMLVAVMRAFPKQTNEISILKFKDKDEMPAWAKDSIKQAVTSEAISGYPDNTFKAQNYVTRAEAFTIICKLKGYHQEHVLKN